MQVMSVAFVAGGKGVVCGAHGSEIQIWDVETQRCIDELRHEGVSKLQKWKSMLLTYPTGTSAQILVVSGCRLV